MNLKPNSGSTINIEDETFFEICTDLDGSADYYGLEDCPVPHIIYAYLGSYENALKTGRLTRCNKYIQKYNVKLKYVGNWRFIFVNSNWS